MSDADGTIRPAFAGGDTPGEPASSPVGAEQRVSDPDDATTRPDELLSAEGPDVETTDSDPAPSDPAETDPLDPTPIPDPDLDAPSQEDSPA